MAVSFHSLPCETASTSRPSARSLLATHALGVNVPTVVPVVWSSPRLMTMKRGIVPFFSKSAYSFRKTSTLSVSRIRAPFALRTP